MTILAWALRLAPYAALLGFYLWAQNGWHNNVADRMEKRAVAAETSLKQARDQIEAMNTAAFKQQERWGNVVTAETERAKADAAKRAAADLKRRAEDAHRDPVSRSVAIPDSARRMLTGAYEAATATGPAAAPEEAAAPDTSATVADLTAWNIELLDWSVSCQQRVFDWEHYYERLQHEQGNGLP